MDVTCIVAGGRVNTITRDQELLQRANQRQGRMLTACTGIRRHAHSSRVAVGSPARSCRLARTPKVLRGSPVL